MEPVHFLLSYIPFWAVPLFLISSEFAYTYWLKSFRRVSALLGMVSFFSALLIIFYFVAGGSEKSVLLFYDLTK